MGLALSSLLSRSTISKSSIAPPKAAKGIVAGLAHSMDPNYRPLKVVNEGEALFVKNALESIIHYASDGVTVRWTVAPIAFGLNYWVTIYWDNVDNKLYVLTTDTMATKLQLGSIDVATGVITTIGASWTPTVGMVQTELSYNHLSRFGGAGIGDLFLSIATTTGMGSIQIPMAGGSGVEVTNIQVGGVNPTSVAPYKVDTDLYISGITIQDPYGVYNGSTAYMHNPNQALSIVTPKVHGYSRITTDFKFGIAGANGQAHIPSYVTEWGGDICMCSSYTSQRISGAILYDKADFHRWAKDIDNMYCGGAW